MDSAELKFNPLQEEDQSEKKKKEVSQGNQKIKNENSSQPKPAKPVFKLIKDLWHYIWHEEAQGDKIKNDLMEIDQDRNKKKLKIAKRQQKIEAKARQKAQIKAKQAQARLIKEQKQVAQKQAETTIIKTMPKPVQAQPKKQELKKEVNKKIVKSKKPSWWARLFKPKTKEEKLLKQKKKAELKQVKTAVALAKKAKRNSQQNQSKKVIEQARSESLKKLAEEKFNQNRAGNHGLIDHKYLVNSNSALQSGLLQPVARKEKLKIKPTKPKKPSFWSKLLTRKPKLIKKAGLKPVATQKIKFNGFQAPSNKKVGEISLKLTDFSKHKEKMTKRLSAEREKYANLKIRQDIENKYWHSHNIVRANLIKEQATLFFNWQNKILTMVLALGLALLTVGILYGGLLVWESKKLNDNQAIFNGLERINEKIKEEEAFAGQIMQFNDKLILVDYILDNHIYWTNFFKFLEDYTIIDVYYEGFDGDIGGKYSLPAIAKDYRSVYLQLKLMQSNDQVISANTEGAEILREQVGVPEEGQEPIFTEKIKFILDLLVDRKIFLR